MAMKKVIKILAKNNVTPYELRSLVNADFDDVLELMQFEKGSLYDLLNLMNEDIEYTSTAMQKILFDRLRDKYNAVKTYVCPSEDRIIHVKFNDKKEIIELNFMQGHTETELFNLQYKTNDEACLRFYNALKDVTPYREMEMLDRINSILWAYVSIDSEFNIK
jgi:hypothetical protein